MGAGKKLWGYYPTTDTWIPLQVDDQGKVVVDMSAITLGDLADVTGAGAVEGDMLYFDEVSETFMVGARANLAELFANLVELNDLSDVTIAGLADGHFLSYSEGLGYWQNRLLAEGDIPNLDAGKIASGSFPMGRMPTELRRTSLTFVIDGGGSAITTGQKGHLYIPFACVIEWVNVLADKIGSIVVDIWKDDYAHFPPTDADSITAAAPPTIVGAQKYFDGGLAGWTKSISLDDILAFNIDSCTTITRVTVSLNVLKS